MTRHSRLAAGMWLALAGLANAQTVAVEAVQTVGGSSESIFAAATQLRASGEPMRGLRLKGEASWGDRSKDVRSDVFGTAYPYGGKAQVIEAWAEYTLRPAIGLRSVRVGRYRTPFGISSDSDHAYVGFHRPPLIRYGSYWGLSSGYLEHGIDIVAGVPRLTLEASLGRPSDVGDAIRLPGTDKVARAQAAVGPVIIGASAIDTQRYVRRATARGRAKFKGVDARVMVAGVQLRGEWLDGQSLDNTSTTGGYVDAILHRRWMGPVTALARAEKLDYNTSPRFALHTRRYTGGLRVRVWSGVAASAGLVHQAGQVTQQRATALDASLTFALRKDLTSAP